MSKNHTAYLRALPKTLFQVKAPQFSISALLVNTIDSNRNTKPHATNEQSFEKLPNFEKMRCGQVSMCISFDSAFGRISQNSDHLLKS